MQKDTNDVETQNGVHEEIKLSNDQKLKIFDSFNLKSACGHQASFLCASRQCEQDAAICNSFCKACRNRHKKCVDAKIANNIYQKIDSSIIELDSEDKSIMKKVQQKSDQIVDEVSLMTNSLTRQIKLLGLNQYNRDLAYCLLKRLDSKTNKDEEIIKILQEGEFFSFGNQKFHGDTINQLFEQVNYQSNDWFDESIQRLKTILEKSKQMITSYFDDIQDCLLNLHTKHHKTLDSKCYFSSSKILNTEKIEQFWNGNFQKHLEKAGINGLPLKKIFTYRLSFDQQYNHLDNKIFDIIQGKKDLLFLLENEYHKRFGFFTPLQFDSQNNGWIADRTCNTMIFSLDANRSEFITNKQYSLKYDSQDIKISVGGIFQKQNNQDGKKCGIQLVMNYIPHCEINMTEQKIQQQNRNTNQMQLNQPQSPFQFKVLNGYQKGQIFEQMYLIKLEVYQVQRPVKQQQIIAN